MNKFEDLVPCDKNRLVKECRARNTSIPEISRKIGCSPTTVYKYLGRGGVPRKMMNAICDVLFERNQAPLEEKDPIFPIYTKDLLMAKFYLKRALDKMDEIYLRNGGR